MLKKMGSGGKRSSIDRGPHPILLNDEMNIRWMMLSPTQIVLPRFLAIGCSWMDGLDLDVDILLPSGSDKVDPSTVRELLGLVFDGPNNVGILSEQLCHGKFINSLC